MNTENLIDKIEKCINDTNNFSGVINIRKDSRVLYSRAYGFADISNKRENNAHTRFGIASGAKLFTSLAICRLVEKRKLRFDSLLKDYLDVDAFDDNITIKNLLTHTSGLPDYFDEDVMTDFSELWIDNPMYLMQEPKDFIKLMMNMNSMFKPGEKFHYNNGAFVVLAYIVEKVSGMKFTHFVEKNILDVLNMDRSGYFRLDMLPENCAYGYEKTEDGRFKTNIYSIPVIGGGDGGIFVTAEDVSRLWNGLFTYKLLNKKITDELLSMQVHAYDDVYYGYGIRMEKKNDSVYKYYITGSDPGVKFISAVYPEDNLEITILGNREFKTAHIVKCIDDMVLSV